MARKLPTKQTITADTWEQFGLPRPNTEERVCEDRRWRVDFFWPAGPLAVEVHGGMWAGGRHARSPKDFAKGHRCALNGWHRMEFSPQQVTSGYAPAMVKAFLDGDDLATYVPPDPEDRRKRKPATPPATTAHKGKGGRA